MRYGKENAVILPSAVGTSGQALVYNGTNTLAWASTLPDMMTLSTAQTATGAKTFSAPTTTFGAAAAAAKLTTAGTSLVMEQTGGTFGTTRLTIINENGMNGAMFEQAGTPDVIDFIFKSLTGQSNVRYERRTASFLDTTNTLFEFQIGNPAAAGLVVGDTVVTARTATMKVGTGTVYHTNNIPGTTPQMLYNSGTGMAGAANTTIENGYLKILTNMPTTVPVVGGVAIGAKNLGGREMAAAVDSTNQDYTFQPHFGRNKIYQISPNAGLATVSAYGGLAAPTVSGAGAKTPASTNLLASLTRTGFTTAASLAALSYMRGTTLQWWRGNATGLGGFHMVITFGIPDTTAVASKRMFLGLYGTAANPTNVEPTSLFNLIGIGKVSTSNNLGIITNAASGTGTFTDLGTGFPATGTTGTQVYMFTLFQPPGGGNPGYRLDRLDTNTTVSGTITATLPVNTAFMTETLWCCNNAVATACGFDFANFYLETDT